MTRIDPATGTTANIEAGVPGEGGDLKVGRGSVWARGSSRLLTGVDADSNEVVARQSLESKAVLVKAVDDRECAERNSFWNGRFRR
jgi:hypothetical protein